MRRVVQKELLDDLPAADPAAAASRDDLVRLNAWMGNARTAARALSARFARDRELRLVEIGGGDGRFFLEVARRLHSTGLGGSYTLVDKHPIFAQGALGASLDKLGWELEVVTTDLFDWVSAAGHFDAVLANLFLHHWSPVQLARMFEALSSRCDFFLALEPRRNFFALALSHLVGLIGCGSVTRHDAVVSVRAGFTGSELSSGWAACQGWAFEEGRAGLFTHLFSASRHQAPVLRPDEKSAAQSEQRPAA